MPCATDLQLAELQHPAEGNGNSPGIYGIRSQSKLVLPGVGITPQPQGAFVAVWELPNLLSETDTVQGADRYSVQLSTKEFVGSNGRELVTTGVTLEPNNLAPEPVTGPNGASEPIAPVCFEDGCYIQSASVIIPPLSSGIGPNDATAG